MSLFPIADSDVVQRKSFCVHVEAGLAVSPFRVMISHREQQNLPVHIRHSGLDRGFVKVKRKEGGASCRGSGIEALQNELVSSEFGSNHGLSHGGDPCIHAMLQHIRIG